MRHPRFLIYKEKASIAEFNEVEQNFILAFWYIMAPRFRTNS